MQSLRRLLLAHSQLTALICVAALTLRLLFPTGYMITNDHGRVAITLCSGFVEQQPFTTMDMPGMDHATQDPGKSKEHGKAEMPCAFSGLLAQALGGADPLLLVAALAVVAAMALCALQRAMIISAPYVRPYLRGPPPFH